MAQKGVCELNEQEFERGIGSGKVLVDFFADWCGPCRTLAPVLETVARDVAGQAVVAKLNIDKAQEIAARFSVTSIPTMILFRDGKEVGRLVGLRDATSIKDFVLTT